MNYTTEGQKMKFFLIITTILALNTALADTSSRTVTKTGIGRGATNCMHFNSRSSELANAAERSARLQCNSYYSRVTRRKKSCDLTSGPYDSRITCDCSATVTVECQE